jgi:hypothetical protein
VRLFRAAIKLALEHPESSFADVMRGLGCRQKANDFFQKERPPSVRFFPLLVPSVVDFDGKF